MVQQQNQQAVTVSWHPLVKANIVVLLQQQRQVLVYEHFEDDLNPANYVRLT